MPLPYGPPYPVSPLIRGLRWSLLIAGFFYGRVKQKLYEALEADWREQEAARKIIRDKQIAIMKARIAREERETVRLLETGKLFELDEIEPAKTQATKTKQVTKEEVEKKCKTCGICDNCDCD